MFERGSSEDTAAKPAELPKEADSGTFIPSSMSQVDLTKEEQRSLSFYLQRTGRMVAKYGHSRYDFWTRIVPQAAHQYPALRHRLTALALYDEAITSSSLSMDIDRRIEYHHHQSLRRTITERRTLAVLFTCLISFYGACLLGDEKAIFLHLGSAKRIVDEYKLNNIDSQDIVDNHIAPIVDECLTYVLNLSAPSVDLSIDWRALPMSPTEVSLDDAEYELTACILNLCRPNGQVRLALVRANAFLQQWRRDFPFASSQTWSDREKSAISLYHVAQAFIAWVDPYDRPQAEGEDTWMALLLAVQDFSEMSSARIQKPLLAVISFMSRRCPDWGSEYHNVERDEMPKGASDLTCTSQRR
jgi:hypothetical protein